MAFVVSRRNLLLGLSATAACKAGASAPTDGRPAARDVRLPNGVTLHTVALGARTHPTRWFLHGGPGFDHTYLRPACDTFVDSGRVRYVDLRGHGLSSAPPSAEGYELAAAADDLAALAGALREPSIDLVAHDFGATVAILAAVRHPGLVRSLVLVAPLRDGGQLRAVGQRSRTVLGETAWRSIRDLTTPQGTLRDSHRLKDLFRALGPMWWAHPPTEETLDTLTRTMRYRAEADANFLQAATRWDARVWAARVRCPVLVVQGAQDRTFPADESQSLADALPHGRMVSIPDAGHLPFVEAPVAFAAALRTFWSR